MKVKISSDLGAFFKLKISYSANYFWKIIVFLKLSSLLEFSEIYKKQLLAFYRSTFVEPPGLTKNASHAPILQAIKK